MLIARSQSFLTNHFFATLINSLEQIVRLNYCIPLIIYTYHTITVKGVIEFSILKGRNLVPMDTRGKFSILTNDMFKPIIIIL